MIPGTCGLAGVLLWPPTMTRRFATRSVQAETVSLHSLLARTPGARLPLETSLHVAWGVVTAVAEGHARGQRFSRLDPASLDVNADGSMVAREAVADTADDAADVAAVGGVLYQLFTGLSPSQARARLQVPKLHEVPAPSKVNPALDDTLDLLVVGMLTKDPADRPALRVVESVLASVLDELGLEPSQLEVARWAGLGAEEVQTEQIVLVEAPVAPAPAAAPAAPVVVKAKAPVARRQPPRSWQLDEEEEEDFAEAPEQAWTEPVRFDAWAALLCVFSIAVFAMALSW